MTFHLSEEWTFFVRRFTVWVPLQSFPLLFTEGCFPLFRNVWKCHQFLFLTLDPHQCKYGPSLCRLPCLQLFSNTRHTDEDDIFLFTAHISQDLLDFLCAKAFTLEMVSRLNALSTRNGGAITMRNIHHFCL